MYLFRVYCSDSKESRYVPRSGSRFYMKKTIVRENMKDCVISGIKFLVYNTEYNTTHSEIVDFKKLTEYLSLGYMLVFRSSKDFREHYYVHITEERKTYKNAGQMKKSLMYIDNLKGIQNAVCCTTSEMSQIITESVVEYMRSITVKRA